MRYFYAFLLLALVTACAGSDPIIPTVSMPTETTEPATIPATSTSTNIPPTATVASTPSPVPSPTIITSPTTVPIRQSDGHSRSPEISGDGRYIAFLSRGKLTENSIHDAESLYIYDQETDQVELVSVALDGYSSKGRAFHIALSSSGRYVGFHSHGGDLVSGDDELCDNGWSNCADLFIYDRQRKQMTRIPHGTPTGETGRDYPWVTFSPDEQFFYTLGSMVQDSSNFYDLNTYEPVFPDPMIEYLLPDGLTAHFWNSEADDREKLFNASELLNLGHSSGGGTVVAFSSMPEDLTDKSINLCEDVTWNAEGLRPCFNIFIHNLETGETRLATVDSDGWSSNADTSWPMMSANGRFLIFHSAATNLTDDDFPQCNYEYDCRSSNVFLYDVETGKTILISRDVDTDLPAGSSRIGDISGDGRYITFFSEAENLVHGDTNKVSDIFLYDRLTQEIVRISNPN